MQRKIPCAILRGGTSKGLYLLEKDLPPAGPVRDAVLLRLMGSPDARQIDGLGGSYSVTSKAAIVAPSLHTGADVDYTFAQVSITQPTVSYAGNCGNISSGVGPFAIEAGLVPAQEGLTRVRIYNTNTGKVMLERVLVKDGQVCYAGDTAIPGVPGTAAPVKVEIQDPAGAVCGALLPTGQAAEQLEVAGIGAVEVSLVDAANPLVFVRAADLDLTGLEMPSLLDADPALLERLERVRAAAAVRLGLAECWQEAAIKTPGVPKLCLLAPPAAYTAANGHLYTEGEMDLHGRMLSMQKAHQTYALTGAMCTAAAAAIPGTLVAQTMRPGADAGTLRIAHPGGVMVAGAEYTQDGTACPVIRSAYGIRTARLLMRGTAYIPEEVWPA